MPSLGDEQSYQVRRICKHFFSRLGLELEIISWNWRDALKSIEWNAVSDGEGEWGIPGWEEDGGCKWPADKVWVSNKKVLWGKHILFREVIRSVSWNIWDRCSIVSNLQPNFAITQRGVHAGVGRKTRKMTSLWESGNEKENGIFLFYFPQKSL